MSSVDRRKDLKLLGGLAAGVVVLIVAITAFTPHANEQDPKPTTTNAGSAGAKAAFLTLQAMGRTAVRWDESSAHIAQLDAPRTTLVLADPDVDSTEQKDLAARLKDFMDRGGRVLLMGAADAGLLPDGQAELPGQFAPKLCDSTPEGPGTLARAGSVEMAYSGSWSAVGPQFRVEQRCQGKPVVVRFPVGAGEAVWWSTATPLTNAGLKRDANLRLLLASLGEGRDVYFDEYYFGQHAGEREDPVKGLPIHALEWQLAALFALLVWSFSRRKGPLRMPVTVPRSSPVEFAQSMGGLYGKARATEPPIEAAQRRLERVLMSEAGLSREAVRQGPDAVADALQARFGGDWSDVRKHLAEAHAASSRGGEKLSPGDALTLVRAMSSDEARLRAMLTPVVVSQGAAGTAAASSTNASSFVKGTASAVP